MSVDPELKKTFQIVYVIASLLAALLLGAGVSMVMSHYLGAVVGNGVGLVAVAAVLLFALTRIEPSEFWLGD